MTTAPATPPAVAKKAESGYVLLLATEDGWTHLHKSQAKTAILAIREWAAKTTTLNGATVVAIPARSWRPVKVTAKTETKLVVEEVK